MVEFSPKSAVSFAPGLAPAHSLAGAQRPRERRAAIAAEAKHTIASHRCDICDAGSWCDTIVHAQHVLTLDDILVDQEAAVSAAEEVANARHEGRIEGASRALAIIGRAEGELRTQADGDTHHPSFALAEIHRGLAALIREELADPNATSALEVAARNEEASDLSAYVYDVSMQYQSKSNPAIAKALVDVAGDIAKGSTGVARLKAASDVATPTPELRQLLFDQDADVRWWASQNPSAPVDDLTRALEREKHPTVIAALLANPHLPLELVADFENHPHADVAGAAKRRLGA